MDFSLNPIELAEINCAEFGTNKVNLPELSVIVPSVEPLRKTEINGNGSPVTESVTMPVSLI